VIFLTFRGECPYCNAEYEHTSATESDIEGDYVDICDDCGKRFLIHWLMIADAETMAIADVSPPVRCKVDLELFLDDDDDEIQDGEAQA